MFTCAYHWAKSSALLCLPTPSGFDHGVTIASTSHRVLSHATLPVSSTLRGLFKNSKAVTRRIFTRSVDRAERHKRREQAADVRKKGVCDSGCDTLTWADASMLPMLCFRSFDQWKFQNVCQIGRTSQKFDCQLDQTSDMRLIQADCSVSCLKKLLATLPGLSYLVKSLPRRLLHSPRKTWSPPICVQSLAADSAAAAASVWGRKLTIIFRVSGSYSLRVASDLAELCMTCTPKTGAGSQQGNTCVQASSSVPVCKHSVYGQ